MYYKVITSILKTEMVRIVTLTASVPSIASCPGLCPSLCLCRWTGIAIDHVSCGKLLPRFLYPWSATYYAASIVSGSGYGVRPFLLVLVVLDVSGRMSERRSVTRSAKRKKESGWTMICVSWTTKTVFKNGEQINN